MPTPTSADFAAEFQRLLVEQGFVTRNMSHGILDPDEEQQAVIDARATRLLELAQLLGQDNPGRYVNERLAAWLKMNPLAMTNHLLIDKLGTEDTHTVHIQIGEPGNGGYFYSLTANDIGHGIGTTLRVPDSIAEHFRQQGRRALQSELRAALNVPRA